MLVHAHLFAHLLGLKQFLLCFLIQEWMKLVIFLSFYSNSWTLFQITWKQLTQESWFNNRVAIFILLLLTLLQFYIFHPLTWKENNESFEGKIAGFFDLWYNAPVPQPSCYAGVYIYVSPFKWPSLNFFFIVY